MSYSKPVCRGSWTLGTACGRCERCEETRFDPVKPTLPPKLVTDLKPEDLGEASELLMDLARRFTRGEIIGQTPYAAKCALAMEMVTKDLADRARMEKAIEDLTADRDAWKADAKHYMVAMGRADVERDDDAARAEGVAALQQVEACIEDFKSGLCCPRPQGCEQNDSEYCLVRQAFARAGLIPDPYASPLPQQTALVEQGVEKIIAQHEPTACGASAPSEPPRSDGGGV